MELCLIVIVLGRSVPAFPRSRHSCRSVLRSVPKCPVTLWLLCNCVSAGIAKGRCLLFINRFFTKLFSTNKTVHAIILLDESVDTMSTQKSILGLKSLFIVDFLHTFMQQNEYDTVMWTKLYETFHKTFHRLQEYVLWNAVSVPLPHVINKKIPPSNVQRCQLN